jgi:hypothetical protein
MITKVRKLVATALAIGAVVGLIVADQVRASGDKVAFPENWANGVLYRSVDFPRPPKPTVTGERLAEYREYFVTAGALEALRNGMPIPSGTVITIARYLANLDSKGDPLKDADGRFVKGELYGFMVMEKRVGWGTEYPAELRNGEWEYRFFRSDKRPDDKVNLTACFQCHKQRANTDYVQSFEKLKAFALK